MLWNIFANLCAAYFEDRHKTQDTGYRLQATIYKIHCGWPNTAMGMRIKRAAGPERGSNERSSELRRSRGEVDKTQRCRRFCEILQSVMDISLKWASTLMAYHEKVCVSLCEVFQIAICWWSWERQVRWICSTSLKMKYFNILFMKFTIFKYYKIKMWFRFISGYYLLEI